MLIGHKPRSCSTSTKGSSTPAPHVASRTQPQTPEWTRPADVQFPLAGPQGIFAPLGCLSAKFDAMSGRSARINMHRRCAERTCSFAADRVSARIVVASAATSMTFPRRGLVRRFTSRFRVTVLIPRVVR
jgi:hypothetical protein